MPDRDALARYGLMVGDLQDTIAMALGGEAVTTTVEGRERYTVNVRYPRDLRSDPQAIARDVLISMPGGGTVPLGEVAKVQLGARPDHRSAPRTASSPSTSSSISTTAISAAMSPTRRKRSPTIVHFPPGTYVQWSGQFEYLERATEKLKIVVPRDAADHLPAALPEFRAADRNADRDAVAAVRARRRPVADVVARLQYVGRGRGRLHRARRRRRRNRRRHADLSRSGAERGAGASAQPQGAPLRAADLNQAIMLGAVERVRPKMMTVVAIMAGLMPILWSTGTGSEVMQRIAVPMIGGMVSSTLLTLIVIPAIYAFGQGMAFAGIARCAFGSNGATRYAERRHCQKMMRPLRR